MRENPLRLFRVPHIFLDPKIVHAQIKMQRRGHAYRTHVRCSMAPRPHVIQLRQARDLSQMRNSARMHHRCPDVINQLLLNELLAVINRVEHLAHRNRRRRVLPDQPETLLQLRRSRILQPKQMIRLQTLPHPRRLDRRQPVMHVMQQRNILAKFLPQPRK